MNNIITITITTTTTTCITRPYCTGTQCLIAWWPAKPLTWDVQARAYERDFQRETENQETSPCFVNFLVGPGCHGLFFFKKDVLTASGDVTVEW